MTYCEEALRAQLDETPPPDITATADQSLKRGQKITNPMHGLDLDSGATPDATSTASQSGETQIQTQDGSGTSVSISRIASVDAIRDSRLITHTIKDTGKLNVAKLMEDNRRMLETIQMLSHQIEQQQHQLESHLSKS